MINADQCPACPSYTTETYIPTVARSSHTQHDLAPSDWFGCWYHLPRNAETLGDAFKGSRSGAALLLRDKHTLAHDGPCSFIGFWGMLYCSFGGMQLYSDGPKRLLDLGQSAIPARDKNHPKEVRARSRRVLFLRPPPFMGAVEVDRSADGDGGHANDSRLKGSAWHVQ